jgi:hypothetical protein
MEALTNMIANSGSELDKYSNVDWDTLRESDPIEYVTAKRKYREAQEKFKVCNNSSKRCKHSKPK